MIPALALAATLSTTHAAPLAPVTVTINVVSRERKPVSLEFATSDAFFVLIRDAKGSVVFDSRAGHTPIQIHRTLDFTSGTNRIASYDWGGLTDNRRAPDAPAKYTLHVEMPALQTTLVADLPFALDAPATVATVLASQKPVLFTLAGTQERSGPTFFLRDDTGTIQISRPLGLFPQGIFFVRGSVERSNLGVRFLIDHSAPAASNENPGGTPIPRATAPPK